VFGVTRDAVLTDAQWNVVEPLLPCSDGMRGRPFRDHRQVIEGIIYGLVGGSVNSLSTMPRSADVARNCADARRPR
jgi:hypothetical protein